MHKNSIQDIHGGFSGFTNIRDPFNLFKWIIIGLLLLVAGVGNLSAQVTVAGAYGTASSYSTLAAAFTAINGTAQTNNIIVIQISGSTTETASAVLNADAWASLTIYPTASGCTIQGKVDVPSISLSGAQNVTIDGRVRAVDGTITGTTADLTIDNESLNNTAYTLYFTNSAQNNLIQYCKLLGCAKNSTGGIVTFYSTPTGTGNTNNTITHCELTNNRKDRPYYAIYASGSGGSNAGNTISNNLIHDVWQQTDQTNAISIYIADHSTNFMINGNSFYEGTAIMPNYVKVCSFVYINGGDNYYISNNYMGGGAPLCGGSALTLNANGSTQFILYPIYLNVGPTNSSTVIGNTIQNINYTCYLSTFSTIYVYAGQVNVYNNTIGAASGTKSIQVTENDQNAHASTSYGIYLNNSSSTVTVSNNIIGSIYTSSNQGFAQSFYGIYIPATTGNVTISGNTIGSTTTANSIQTASASTSEAQKLGGIFAKSSGTVTISGNTIANLTNSTTNISTSTYSLTTGIKSTNGTGIISNNTIHDLTIACANSASDSAAVSGITLYGTTLRTVSGNSIYNLSNTYTSFAGNVVGLYYNAGTGANMVSGNFITGLSVSSNSATLYGIDIVTGATTYYNNIISLGGNTATTIYGIYETGTASNNNNLYFNTVYIGGVPTAGALNSYALYSANSANARDFRDNIFDNARSGGTGKHYSIFLSANTGLTIDYNDYWVGTGGVLGKINTNDYTIFANWKTATGQDSHSLNTDPLFVNAGTSLIATDYKVKNAALVAGVTIPMVTVDYGTTTRPSSPPPYPTIGAWELNANYWMGTTTSTSWNTASNWTANKIPGDGDNIEFATANNYGTAAANDLHLDQSHTIGSLINMSLKRLVIPSGLCLKVNTTITAAADSSIYIQTSKTTGINGSLIFHNAASSPVLATVEMYSKASWDLTQASGSKYKWQFFGIPLHSVVAETFVKGSYLRQMHENDNPAHWEQLTLSSTLSSFTGYEITQSAPITYIFKGQLENSDYPVTQQPYTANVTYPGQSLIGNPYTAAIGISNIVFGTSMLKTVYIYNTGSYSDWQTAGNGAASDSIDSNIKAGQYTAIPQAQAGNGTLPNQIPSMQAFLVKAPSLNATNATVYIPYSAVVPNSVAQRAPGTHNSDVSSNNVWTIIDVKGSRFSDRMWIFTVPNCTHCFDNGWDGEKIMGSELAPQLFAMEADGNYQVNSVDNMNNTYLGFQPGEDSNYTLTFNHENLDKYYSSVYLLDLAENKTVDMTADSSQYSFTAEASGKLTKRFKIVTVPLAEDTLGITADVKIFSSERTIFVNNLSNLNGTLALYDISGRLVKLASFGANGITPIQTFFPTGVYIVKANTRTIDKTERIILQ